MTETHTRILSIRARNEPTLSGRSVVFSKVVMQSLRNHKGLVGKCQHANTKILKDSRKENLRDNMRGTMEIEVVIYGGGNNYGIDRILRD